MKGVEEISVPESELTFLFDATRALLPRPTEQNSPAAKPLFNIHWSIKEGPWLFSSFSRSNPFSSHLFHITLHTSLTQHN